MHLKVIVEGIEEPAQVSLLRKLGADEGQGYLLGRPDGNPRARLNSEHEQLRTNLHELVEATLM